MRRGYLTPYAVKADWHSANTEATSNNERRTHSLLSRIRVRNGKSQVAMKILIVACLATVALADNPRPYAPPAPYRPSPYKEEKLPPQPFAYEYGVKDEYTGTDYDKKEQQDAYGNLNGEYRVNLPDGRVQIVTYTADHDNGFIADVRYEGQAQYPPAPKGGYGPYKPPQAPKYRPAPSYS